MSETRFKVTKALKAVAGIATDHGGYKGDYVYMQGGKALACDGTVVIERLIDLETEAVYSFRRTDLRSRKVKKDSGAIFRNGRTLGQIEIEGVDHVFEGKRWRIHDERCPLGHLRSQMDLDEEITAVGLDARDLIAVAERMAVDGVDGDITLSVREATWLYELPQMRRYLHVANCQGEEALFDARGAMTDGPPRFVSTVAKTVTVNSRNLIRALKALVDGKRPKNREVFVTVQREGKPLHLQSASENLEDRAIVAPVVWEWEEE